MAEFGKNPLDARPVIQRSTIHDVAEALSGEQDAYGPEGIGRYLRQVRMQRGVSVRDVSNQIRIRPNQVEALEDGRIDDLPGVVYCLGYVRAYATLLGLDGEEAVRRFKQDAPLAPDADLNLPGVQRESRLPRPAVALVAVLVAVVGYGGWLAYSQKQSEPRVADVPAHLEEKVKAAEVAQKPTADVQTIKDMANATSQPTKPIKVETANTGPVNAGDEPAEITDGADGASDSGQPVTVAGEAADATQDVASSEGEAEENVASTEVPPAVGVSAEAETQDVSSTEQAPEVQQAPEQSTQQSSVLSVASAEAAAPDTQDGRQLGQVADSRVSIRAIADAYVQVKDAENTLFLQRVLRSGDVYHVPDVAGLSMVTGNAGGLEVSVDGRQIPALGDANQIVQGILLEPTSLLNGASN